jgi:hypothetical protein
MLDFKEVHEVRKKLLECHLKDKNGNEIKRLTIPNPDDNKYEGCALKIKRTRLDEASFCLLESIRTEHKLQRKDFEKNGYWTIYTPKKPSKP